MALNYHESRLIDSIDRRRFLKYSSLALGSAIFTACSQTDSNSAKKDLEPIKLTLDWVAEAEYGGFYQAVANGIYQQYGMSVAITQGGPRINSNMSLMGGSADLILGNAGESIKAIENAIPKVTVASIFQKFPTILLAHPGMGNDSLRKLQGKPILLSSSADATFWPVLKLKYGFTDEQKRPYNFNLGPFLADKNAIQQGILTSEPFSVEKEGGFQPEIIFIADHGYNPYSFTIDTTRKMVETKPDLVQRFVDASIKGWYSYLDNPAPGNSLIKRDNPEMSDDLLIFGIEKLKKYQLITGGDAVKMGIGAMTDARWKEFFDVMVETKVFAPTIKYKDAYTLQFVNKGEEYYQK